jgi:hypothetical protein
VSDLDAKLEDAFRRFLKFRTIPTSENALRLAIGCLAYFSTYKASPLAQFRKVGRKAARKELDDLADAAEKLIERFETLSATAISALGGRHIMTAIGTQTRYLRDLAAVARDTDLNAAPDATGKGRPTKERAIYAASIIVGAFESITGCNADLPANRAQKRTRGLVPLTREIFALLGIEANAKFAVEAALTSNDPLALRGRRAIQALAVEQTGQKSQVPVHCGNISQSAEDLFERMRLAKLDERSPRFWKRQKNSPPEDH